VALESFGVPLPGETALIAFGVLASQGHYTIVAVIAIASAGAIVGDNLGYWLIGRLGGRALFRRWHRLAAYANRVLPPADRLMQRYGGRAVFFGRFVSILRYTVAWVGRAHAAAVRYGLYAAVVLVIALGVGWFFVMRVRRRVERRL
jgi:membrane protein DedA with SNARE-associated domain